MFTVHRWSSVEYAIVPVNSVRVKWFRNTEVGAMRKRLSGRWLDIPGYLDRYQVSLDGQVSRLSRIDDGGHLRTLRLLDPNTRRNGRRVTSACLPSYARFRSMCRVVAQFSSRIGVTVSPK